MKLAQALAIWYRLQMQVLRIGRSAYDTDASLRLEALAVESVGHDHRTADLEGLSSLSIKTADMLVVNSSIPVDSALLERFQVGAVLTTTSGYDHVDVKMAKSLGIVVGRAPQLRRDAVVEHGLAEIISHLRRLRCLHEQAEVGRWARRDLVALQPRGLNEVTVAVIGAGVIGSRMVDVLTFLGAKVLVVDPRHHGSVDLDSALAQADIVTIHCDLNTTSKMLFSGECIAKMQRGSILINTARGRLVHVSAAVDAVKNGHLSGFSSDVFAKEPYPEMSMSCHPGIRFTPHASGYTSDLPIRVAEVVKDEIQKWSLESSLSYRVC